MRIFYCRGAKWFDKINGNTYHNAAIIDGQTGQEFFVGYSYGYGDHWKHRCEEEIKRRHPKLKNYRCVFGNCEYIKKADCKNGRF